jgi:hypothetical protein
VTLALKARKDLLVSEHKAPLALKGMVILDHKVL